GTHPHPRQARRLRPRADRRDHRPLRAQGPDPGGPQAPDDLPRDRGDPLRRARRAPLLRRAGRLHHERPARRPHPRGPGRDQGRPPAHRRDEPPRGHPGLHPRRLRHRGRHEHGPRLGLPGVRRARDRDLVSGAL
ncbi:MAG: Nucleoside diphosphate kinase, partial [uncultured Solirubrobacteraceae bacterium]